MKLKISFDKNSILKFFMEHVEKMIFALLMLVSVAVIYGAIMKRHRFDKSTQQLIEQCSSAQRSIEREHSIEDPKAAHDYKKIADKILEFSSKKSIVEEPYRCETAWDQPVFGQPSLRDQPKLFTVKDLRTAAEFGAFRTGPVGAGRSPRDARRPRRHLLGQRRAGAGIVSARGRCRFAPTR